MTTKYDYSVLQKPDIDITFPEFSGEDIYEENNIKNKETAKVFIVTEQIYLYYKKYNIDVSFKIYNSKHIESITKDEYYFITSNGDLGILIIEKKVQIFGRFTDCKERIISYNFKIIKNNCVLSPNMIKLISKIKEDNKIPESDLDNILKCVIKIDEKILFSSIGEIILTLMIKCNNLDWKEKELNDFIMYTNKLNIKDFSSCLGKIILKIPLINPKEINSLLKIMDESQKNLIRGKNEALYHAKFLYHVNKKDKKLIEELYNFFSSITIKNYNSG
jgi:hypothetical protein